MNDLKIISGVSCYEENGTVYLRLEDVARGLGFTRTAASGNEVVMWSRVDGYLNDLGVRTSAHGGYIPENIFYRLAMKAKNETAEKFQALVADEIIPSIRRTGGYIAGQNELSPSELMAKALIVAQNTLAQRDKQIAEMQPKVIFADAVSGSSHTILIGELAKILRQNGVDTGQKRLFETLRNEGYLVRRKGSDYNMPTQRSMELGLFEIKETAVCHSSGHTTVSKTPKVTGKGQQYFLNRFLHKKGERHGSHH